MCDTFAAQPKWTGGPVIFGKNSDREIDETQILLNVQAKENISDKSLACTYIEIPQIEHTNSILLSKPFWIWGAEMGANEKGVVIGNEALFTKYKSEKKPGLIGMDLLRLALERAESAGQAADVIINLLKLYGQSGPCGYRDKKFSYMNSYLIADKKEIIVLETLGRDYAMKHYDEYAAISNEISLSADWEKSSLPDGTDFQTKKDPLMTFFAGGKSRRQCNLDHIIGLKGRMNVRDAFSMLRAHYKDSPSKGINQDVCMHASDPLIRRSHTTGSLVVSLEGGLFKIYSTAGSTPCLTSYKPLLPFNLPADVTRGEAQYSVDSYWWRHEAFVFNALLRYEAVHQEAAAMINELENSYCDVPYYPWGCKDNELTGKSHESFTASDVMDRRLVDKMKEIDKSAGFINRAFLKSIAKKNSIPLI